MPAKVLELVLEHDGRDWIVHGEDINARAASLADLDRALARTLPEPLATEPLTVHMRFNRAALPGWIRQYMPHYFNRVVQLSPAAGTEGGA